MFKTSLSKQIFALLAALSALNIALIAILILPKVEQQVITMEQNLSQAQMRQAQLSLSLGSQFSQALDQQILDFHRHEFKQILQPSIQIAQQLHRQYNLAEQSQTLETELLKQIQALPHKGDTHFWLANDRQQMLYHPHPQIVLANPLHQRVFKDFIQQVSREGEALEQLPWIHSNLVDSKPVIAMHFPASGLIIGADINVNDLSQPLLEAYDNIREIIRQVLDQAAFGEHGQIFFFFADNDYLSSEPGVDMFSVLTKKINPDTNNLYADDFKTAAKNNTELKLLWNRSDDLDNFIYPATAQVAHILEREVYLVSITYPEDLELQAATIRSRFLVSLFGIFIAALLVAWWLSQRIVQPVKDLSLYAQKVETGELSLRNNIERDDELGALAQAINSMVQQLEDTIGGLDLTVAERTETLNQQNHKLSLALADQQALLREVHHRVKNNLSVVLGFIQLQQRRHKNSLEISELLKGLQARIYTIELLHNLLYQVDNVSDINCQDYYCALLNEIWQLYQPSPDITYQINIEVEQQDLEQLISCGQILNELISNSLKYAFKNREKGQIDIHIYSEENRLYIAYKDNGCGLSNSEQLPQNGLGITLLQHLVEGKLKGSIEWQSSNQGLAWLLHFRL